SAIMYSVVETAKENNLSPYHYLLYLFETLPNIDLNNKEEIDKVLPWSMDLPSSCKVPKKVKKTKSNSKINLCCIFWSYLTFTKMIKWQGILKLVFSSINLKSLFNFFYYSSTYSLLNYNYAVG
ncbi:transposase, partial [Bacillus pseudomycoides]